MCGKGHAHPSMAEAEYCIMLYYKMAAGEFHSYSLWKSFPVSKTKDWKPDFTIYNKHGKILSVHECKGRNFSDDNFRLKLALFFERYPKIPVFVNWRQVYPSASGRRIMNLPRKTKKKVWPKRLMSRLIPQGR